MKTLFIIACFVLFSATASAQTSFPSDSPKTMILKEMPKHGKGMMKDMRMKPIGSQNMQINNIGDTLRHTLDKHQGKEIPLDQFIDTDGDGINDNRHGSMGITPKKKSTGQTKSK